MSTYHVPTLGTCSKTVGVRSNAGVVADVGETHPKNEEAQGLTDEGNTARSTLLSKASADIKYQLGGYAKWAYNEEQEELLWNLSYQVVGIEAE